MDPYVDFRRLIWIDIWLLTRLQNEAQRGRRKGIPTELQKKEKIQPNPATKLSPIKEERE
jgi:hypothetical protein